MSFLQELDPNTRERTSLSAGSYGSGKQPGLQILSYIEKASKLDKSGAMRHSFLVSALGPSKEAAEAYKLASSNGKSAAAGNPLEEPDYEGTAFLSLTLHELWLCPEATALAFSEDSRNKEGVIQADWVAKSIQEGEATQYSIDIAIVHFRQVATDKCIAANTPADQLEEAVEAQYKKELQQISIKVGHFLTLQDWSGKERSLQADPTQLVGTKFSGKIEVREFNGKSGAEVTAIWSKSKKA
jgi:hypothetical protein